MEHVIAYALLAQLDPGPKPSSLVGTALDMVMKGGWMMVPLGICSLVAVTIAVERLIVTRLGRVAPHRVRGDLRNAARDPRAALERYSSDPSPLASVARAVLKARHEPRAVRETRAQEAGQREVVKLRTRMRLLSCLPQTATMLGLLGTVFGMIRTFTAIAASGEALGKTEKLAQGIYEAWTATAAGLVVAIPTLLAYHVIMGRIDAAAAALDAGAAELLEDDAPAETAAPVAQAPAPALNGRAVPGVPQGVGA